MDVVEQGYEDGYLSRLPIADSLPKELRKPYYAAYCRGVVQFTLDAQDVLAEITNENSKSLQLIFPD